MTATFVDLSTGTAAGHVGAELSGPPQRSPSALATTIAVAARTLRKFVRSPQLVVLNTVQGAMFLLIFRYVFGGAIQPAGGLPYVDFLIPGFVVVSLLFNGMSIAVGVAHDLEQGFFDRLRSLPTSRTALVAGRALADTLTVAWGAAVTVGLGFLVGFRLHGTAGDALAAFGLTVAFGFTFVWLFVVLGLLAGNAQAAQGMALLVFPLAFVSGAYVPVDSMPGWMQPIAEHQPITIMANATRSLTLGGADAAGLVHTTGYWVGLSLLWSAALIAVFVPLAVARYRRTGLRPWPPCLLVALSPSWRAERNQADTAGAMAEPSAGHILRQLMPTATGVHGHGGGALSTYHVVY